MSTHFINIYIDRKSKKLIEKYEAGIYSLEKLKNYDLRAIRGTRRMPEKALDFLNRKEEK